MWFLLNFELYYLRVILRGIPFLINLILLFLFIIGRTLPDLTFALAYVRFVRDVVDKIITWPDSKANSSAPKTNWRTIRTRSYRSLQH